MRSHLGKIILLNFIFAISNFGYAEFSEWLFERNLETLSTLENLGFEGTQGISVNNNNSLLTGIDYEIETAEWRKVDAIRSLVWAEAPLVSQLKVIDKLIVCTKLQKDIGLKKACVLGLGYYKETNEKPRKFLNQLLDDLDEHLLDESAVALAFRPSPEDKEKLKYFVKNHPLKSPIHPIYLDWLNEIRRDLNPEEAGNIKAKLRASIGEKRRNERYQEKAFRSWVYFATVDELEELTFFLEENPKLLEKLAYTLFYDRNLEVRFFKYVLKGKFSPRMRALAVRRLPTLFPPIIQQHLDPWGDVIDDIIASADKNDNSDERCTDFEVDPKAIEELKKAASAKDRKKVSEILINLSPISFGLVNIFSEELDKYDLEDRKGNVRRSLKTVLRKKLISERDIRFFLDIAEFDRDLEVREEAISKLQNVKSIPYVAEQILKFSVR